MATEAAPPTETQGAKSPWADTEGDAPAPGAQHANPRPLDKEWEEIKAKALKGDAAPPAKTPEPKKGKGKKADAAPPATEPETPAPPSEESKPPNAREWAVLNHKREKLQKKEAAFQQRYDQGQKELAAVEARTKEVETRERALEALETDPKAFVEAFAKKLGVSPTKVINSLNTFFLEGRTPTDLELDKVKADLKRRDEDAKKKADEDEAKKKDDAKRAGEAKVIGYIKTIKEHVTANADSWVHLPNFAAEDVARTAWARITSHYDQTGTSLPLDKVLATLDAEEEVKFLAREERRKRRLAGGTSQDPEPSGAGKAASPGQQRPSTLNHGLATQRGSPSRQLSDREAWEESKKRAGIG